MTGVSFSRKLLPDLYTMHAPIRCTGDDVGKNTKGNNCEMSVDMKEMGNV